MITTKTITKYITSDGKEFDTELEALRHEVKYLSQGENKDVKIWSQRDLIPGRMVFPPTHPLEGIVTD
jgi:hypothetical protein